jgi:hypothetical protein
VKKKSFLDDSDRNELSEILTRQRLKSANVKAPPRKQGATADKELEEILDHVRAASRWQGPKKAVGSKKALKKLSGI